jgi:hypothetical protein
MPRRGPLTALEASTLAPTATLCRGGALDRSLVTSHDVDCTQFVPHLYPICTAFVPYLYLLCTKAYFRRYINLVTLSNHA